MQCGAVESWAVVLGAFRQAGIRRISSGNVLSLDNLNPNIKKMEYAVRGPIVNRALEIEAEMKRGVKKPFSRVIKANIGDAHGMGQKPISFIREVVACVANPVLLESAQYNKDVMEHANAILGGCGGRSAGSYSNSAGVEVIRKHVADYIQDRDGGIPSNSSDIVLSGGASESIRNVLKLFVNKESSKKTGVMIPIPQYPLYSATVEEYGMGQVGYYLDEKKGWALETSELERALKESRTKYDTRVLCVINPGNPTGQVLSEENIKKIIRFAHENDLFLLADEVYQDNIYAKGSRFHSFKKVMKSMGEPYSNHEMASFHSASKGYMGECGMRGGYVELLNMDGGVRRMYDKMISAKLCSTVLGQTVMDCVVNPPKPGEASYEGWLTEKTQKLASLRERASMVKEAFDSMEGIECNPVQGAMYAFPSLHLPSEAIEKARSLNQPPDFFYAMQLLEQTGICVVPGSGFGQREGTYHFRTTILPQPALMKEMMAGFKAFHTRFMKRYSLAVSCGSV